MSAPAAAPPRTPPPAPAPLPTELRRGLGPWLGLTVAALVLAGMYGKGPGWQGRWTDTTDMLHVTTGLLGGPLVLAAGCVIGGRERRRGTLELLGSVPRDPVRRALVAAAPAAAWPAAGHLVAALVCLATTWPYAGGAGRPFLELVLADTVALASLGVLGHVAGRLVGGRLTAPLLAVVGYVGLAVGSYTDSGARWLGPAAEHRYYWDQPVGWFAPASAAWTGGLALAALVACAAHRGRPRLWALVPLAVALAAGAAVLRLPADGPWRPDPAAARLVCDGGSPQVCLPAVDRALLPQVSAALAPLNARLHGLPGAPVRWRTGPGEPGPGDRSLPDPAEEATRGRLDHPDQYVNAVAQWLISETCRPGDPVGGPGTEQAALVQLAVLEWLAPAPDGYGVDSAPARPLVDRLKAKSPEEQRRYLARFLAADRCDPAEVPLP
ncbi:hypothetical protein [Streptomyces sp. NPDC048338]|uniref:hypothetical protein n=1 Tax=Streptomyces sp. NPDC048338 TaxID=3365536 RepID=UPI003723D697